MQLKRCIKRCLDEQVGSTLVTQGGHCRFMTQAVAATKDLSHSRVVSSAENLDDTIVHHEQDVIFITT